MYIQNQTMNKNIGGSSGMCKITYNDALVRIIKCGASWNVQANAIYNNVYTNIGDSLACAS